MTSLFYIHLYSPFSMPISVRVNGHRGPWWTTLRAYKNPRGGGQLQDVGGFVFIAQHKNITKIVVTIRHDFWAQNVPKMLLRPELHPNHAAWVSSQRYPCSPLARFRGRFAAGKGGNGGKWKVEKGWNGGEWKVEGRRGGEGRNERERKGGSLVYWS